MSRINLKDFMPYLFMLPSIYIGTLAMISHGVPTSIWIQNIIIWILGTILSYIFLIKRRRKHLNKVNFIPTILIIALLVLPFYFIGINGVHRWLTFGPINLYVASVFLPLLIIYLWNLTLNQQDVYVIGLTIIVLVILLFHPDAGQVTAFACAAVIILWKNNINKILKGITLTISTAVVSFSWIFIDDLALVPYVEHIIFLVADMGVGWFILGILSLILLLIPFFVFWNINIVSIALGVYFLMSIVVTFFGNFPMPIMGYGTSPIIGYLIAITWVHKMS